MEVFEVKTSKDEVYIIHEEENTYNYIFQIENPYTMITIPKDKERAILYGDGTQFSLKYIIEKYKHITKFYISDTSSYDLHNGNISVITPRHLLTGRKGYYEQILNAYPIKNTIELIDTINENQNEIKELIPKNVSNDWWTPENVYNLADLISPDIISPTIMNTQWEVSKDIIDNYDIEWNANPIKRPFSGGTRKKQINDRVKYMMKTTRFMKV